MDCPKCNSKTAVVDRRGVKRRRKCLSCDYRFSTAEVLVQGQSGFAQKAASKAKPKTKPKDELNMAAVKSAASARRRIEELREMRELNALLAGDDYLLEG